MSQTSSQTKWISIAVIIVLVVGLVAFLFSRNGVDLDDLPPMTDSLSEDDVSGEQVATNTMPASDATTVDVVVDAATGDASMIPSTSDSSGAMMTASAYADGTYSATGHYTSPAGSETVGVSLTLKGNVVTDVAVKPESSNFTSALWQKKFASGVAKVVVGQPIDSIKLDVVSGSSLTPIGFMDALASIKVAAKS